MNDVTGVNFVCRRKKMIRPWFFFSLFRYWRRWMHGLEAQAGTQMESLPSFSVCKIVQKKNRTQTDRQTRQSFRLFTSLFFCLETTHEQSIGSSSSMRQKIISCSVTINISIVFLFLAFFFLPLLLLDSSFKHVPWLALKSLRQWLVAWLVMSKLLRMYEWNISPS